MGGEAPVICTQCGYKLGESNQEISHPDDPDPPRDAHFQVQVRKDGEERLQCTETGRLAAPAEPGDDGIGSEDLTYIELYESFYEEEPPGMGEAKGSHETSSNTVDRRERSPGGIYEVDEEKSQMDILADVITNPRYGLNDDHIAEVREWGEDMDGRLPPGTLEDILKNLSGIQKQTAGLIRQRYELKLNKWMRDQSNRDEGPSIGVSTQVMAQQNGSSRPSRGSTPTTPRDEDTKKQKEEEKPSTKQGRQVKERQGSDSSNLREFRRTRRTERRQEVLDITAQRAAEQAADEIAREFVSNFGTYFGLPAKIIEAKIEKDPDWALEKAEQLDVDVFSLMEPSEQRKKELRENGDTVPQADAEVDNALEQLTSNNVSTETDTAESTMSPRDDEQSESIMSDSADENGITPEPDDEPLSEEDDRDGAELFE